MSRKPKLWIVDDDQENRLQYKELAGNGYSVREFESLYAAAITEGGCDYLILDISACGSGSLTDPLHSAYSPILAFYDRHPHTKIIISSGFGKTTLIDVFDQVSSIAPQCELVYHDITDPSELRRLINAEH